MPQIDIAGSLSQPAVYVTLSVLGLGLLILLARQVSRIPKQLLVLMATAFVDMIGVFLVVPLVPFLLNRFGTEGVSVFGRQLDVGLMGGLLASAFNGAQLISAPFWGRFSDRYGRRPALMVALTASAAAYVLFGFADSLWLLFVSRLVQGAGGGTVGVIQAYVADSTAPEERARALGWLSAATNLGVALGPVLGAAAVWVGGGNPEQVQDKTQHVATLAPGLMAAGICVLNMIMAARHLPESNQLRDVHGQQVAVGQLRPTPPPRKPTGEAVWHVLQRASEPSSRLIWIYAIAIGAFQGTGAVLGLFLIKRFQVTQWTINWFFMYQGAISVFARVLLLGRLLDRLGEARLSRLGIVLLAAGLLLLPFADSLGWLALAVGLMPLGTAFTFPCVTGLLSRVVAAQDRGLYMGVQQTFGGAARIAAPLFYGIVFDTVGIGSPWLFAAGFVLATMPLGFGLGRYSKRSAPAR
jgi:MFS family permease